MNEVYKIMNNRHKQKGIVLIVSLIILLVLSMVSISAMSHSTMGERMTNNFQQDMISFQASETGISRVINDADPGGDGTSINLSYSEVTDPLFIAITAGIDVPQNAVHNTDPLNNVPVAVQTQTAVTYKRDSQMCPGMSVGSQICAQFEVAANTDIGGVATGARHIQGVDRVMPAPAM